MRARDNERALEGRSIPGGRDGFTMLELLVVLVILGLLTAVTAPAVGRYLGGAKVDTAKLQVQNLLTTLDLYRLDNGTMPTQEQGLTVLVEKPSGAGRWNGPYVRKADMLRDPWGRPYQYRIPGEKGEIDVFSLGADGAPGGTGENQDIGSW